VHITGRSDMPDWNSRMVGMYMATVRYTMATLLSTAVIWHTHIVPQIRVSCGGTTSSSTGIGFFFGIAAYCVVLRAYGPNSGGDGDGGRRPGDVTNTNNNNDNNNDNGVAAVVVPLRRRSSTLGARARSTPPVGSNANIRRRLRGTTSGGGGGPATDRRLGI